MIWHFFEVWLLFLVVFAVGCGLGALLHVGLAAGPMAVVQDRVAYAVGNGIDRLKWRLGIAPDWRPEFNRTRAWPDLGRAPDEPAANESLAAYADDDVRDRAADNAWADDGWSEDATPEEHAFEGAEVNVAEAVQFDEAGVDRAEADALDMMRPAGLPGPRAGVPDNLQRIWGIGKRNEELLNSLGIYHYGQIASWTPAEARWVASRLTFPERLERDNWIGQAIVLATGGDPSTVRPSNGKRTLDTEED